MLFPSLDSLATIDVITAPREATISEAMGLMKRHNIRDVIIEAHQDYYILTAQDLIRFRLEGVGYETPLSAVPLSRVPQVPPQANVLEAMEAVKEGIDYLCLVDEAGALCGIVSYSDLAASIDPEILVETQRIGELFRKEQTLNVHQSTPTQAVFELMKTQQQSAAIVHDGERAVGILTQKDIIALLSENSDLGRAVGEFMSTPLITIPETLTIQEALRFSQENHIKRIVVEGQNGRILGIVSQKDLVTTAYNKWARLIKNHQEELKELNQILQQRTQTLEKMASTDALTGLFNRHMFGQLFTREMAQKKRYKAPLSVILFDIDHFKKINDSFGHLAGDEVLKKVAAIAQEKVRLSDVAARWGGEEFVVLLPHTPLEGARITAEKIRTAIEATDFIQPGRVTASFGIAECLEDEEQEPLFDRADKALYRAKADGRNRTVTA